MPCLNSGWLLIGENRSRGFKKEFYSSPGLFRDLNIFSFSFVLLKVFGQGIETRQFSRW